MLLQLVWPKKQAVFSCDTLNVDNETVYFCFESAEFVTQKPTSPLGYLSLILRRLNIVFACESDDFQCFINGQPLQKQLNCNLVFDMEIQAGHYFFKVVPATSQYDLLLGQQELPALSEMLSYGGYYTAWDQASEFIETNENADELRTLNNEYHRRLIWGDYQKSEQALLETNTIKVVEVDNYLENVLASVKDKTVSECIIDDKQSIDTIIESLLPADREMSNDIVPTQEQHDEQLYEGLDILQILAPEELMGIERKYITDLTYSELKKTGIDSYI